MSGDKLTRAFLEAVDGKAAEIKAAKKCSDGYARPKAFATVAATNTTGHEAWLKSGAPASLQALDARAKDAKASDAFVERSEARAAVIRNTEKCSVRDARTRAYAETAKRNPGAHEAWIRHTGGVAPEKAAAK